MPVTNYDSIGGEVYGDSSSGDYLRDALDSVTALVPSKVVTNTYRYKPTGGVMGGLSCWNNFRYGFNSGGSRAIHGVGVGMRFLGCLISVENYFNDCMLAC